MATNTLTSIFFVTIGIIVKFLFGGVFTFRRFLKDCAYGAGGWAVGTLILYLVPALQNASFHEIGAVYIGSIIVVPIIYERLLSLDFKAKFGGIEIESKGDDKQ